MALQRILLNDEFTGVDATALTAHWPNKIYNRAAANVMATWSTLHAIPVITSNAASPALEATNYSAVVDLGRQNLHIIADMRTGSNGAGDEDWIKFLFRVKDVNDMIAVQVGKTSDAGIFRILDFIGGTAYVRDSRVLTYAASTDYHVDIQCTGNLIQASVSDGGKDVIWSMKPTFPQVAITAGQNFRAPGTYVGFWQYISATVVSSLFPIVYNFKVLG